MCPLRVKLIAIFFILYSIISGAVKGFVFFDPELYENTKLLIDAAASQGLINVPFSVQITHSLLGVVVIPISCIYMWFGKSWALYLFTFWIASALVLTLLVAGVPYLMVKTPLAVIFLAILYTGKARKYLLVDAKGSNV